MARRKVQRDGLGEALTAARTRSDEPVSFDDLATEVRDRLGGYAPSLADCATTPKMSTGRVRCQAQIGLYNILIGNDSDHPVADPEPYLQAARSAI